VSRYLAFKAAFEILSASRLCPIIRRQSAAKGLIFTLHRVLPDTPADFAPNAILQVTPDFLEQAIIKARADGFDIVDLDEAVTRTKNPDSTRPFVVLTFDDAYRDNLEFALPVLRRHGAPFTLYVPTGLVDAKGEIWWQALEDIIAGNERVRIQDGSVGQYAEAETLAQKHQLFSKLYAHYRTIPETERVTAIHALADAHDFDLAAHCRSLIMDWDELSAFVSEPLCTIGAHTVHHYELAKLPVDEARTEMAMSADIIARKFGRRPKHFSFPIGAPVSAGSREFELAKELGFVTAVTTRPGAIYQEHGGHLTALPRVSLNGNFQKRRYLDVFLTGAVFSALNGYRKVNAA